MAGVQWSTLPNDILSIIAKNLNTEVDTIRLRSICSSWRASVRPRLRPNPFPLRLPPFSSNPFFPSDGNLFLSHATLYHLSRPEIGPCAGDPSDGWLFCVLEVNPNLFRVLPPITPEKFEYSKPLGTIPKSLNLLDYRISEVCKSYCLTFSNGKQSICAWPIAKKVIVLWNYAVGCEFAVLVLSMDWRMCYWKFGDKEWTSIDTKTLLVSDVAVCEVADFPHLPSGRDGNDSYLVEYKSDLYAFTKIVDVPRDLAEGGEGGDIKEIPLRLEIFKKCNDWKHIDCLGNVMFISADDYSFGFSRENFRGLKGNCVYMVHGDPAYSHCYGQKLLYGAYNLDKVGKTSIMNCDQDSTFLYWPPPKWLMSSW